MKKRSLSLLLSLVMLVVLMLGSSVSVLADTLTITPASVNIAIKGSQEFEAKGGNDNQGYTWTCTDNGGTMNDWITASGKKCTVTVPEGATLGEYTLTCVNKNKSDTATITVIAQEQQQQEEQQEQQEQGELQITGADSVDLGGNITLSVGAGGCEWSIKDNPTGITQQVNANKKECVVTVDVSATVTSFDVVVTKNKNTGSKTINIVKQPHTIYVNGGVAQVEGTAVEEAKYDDTVTLVPETSNEKRLIRWNSDDVKINGNTFTMINDAVTIEPYWYYNLKDGAGQQFVKNSDKELQFVSFGEFGEFSTASVDTVELTTGDFTIGEGSTKLTLNNAFLRKLSVGWHTLHFEFEHGYTDVAFAVVEKYDPELRRGTGWDGLIDRDTTTEVTVAEAPATTTSPLISPKTSDSAPVAVFAALALVSAAAFVSMKKRG